MRVFLCSTAYDLLDIRAVVVRYLESRGHEVLYHESPRFPAKINLHSHDQCLEAIKDSDIVLCVIDRRYGGTYAGGFPDRFGDEKIDVLGGTRSGGRKRYEVTLPGSRLSIAWCELIAAHSEGIPVMTFARQRTLDEKETRRRNQFVKGFRPAYVEKNEVFDLLDWITKRSHNNWIASYISVVDLQEKLAVWIEELERSVRHAPSPPAATRVPSSRVCIIVEGEIDRAVISCVIQQLQLTSYFLVIPSYGKYRMLNDFHTTVAQYAPDFEHVLVIMDSDAETPEQYEYVRASVSALVERESARNIHAFFAHPDIEAWIVAGTDPETYLKRQGMVNRTDFKRLYGGYTAANIMELVSGRFHVDSAAEVCPEFRKLVGFLMEVGEPRQ